MKKIIVFIVAALLVFSFTGFTPDQRHKKPQSAKTELNKKKSIKGGIKPRKSRKKGIQKSKSKRQPTRNAGKGIKL
jgi:hypothetical protein